MAKRTLYVSGFSSKTRAKDLAAEFEKYGRLVRCDIPAPKNAQSRVYAFVEFEDDRDADVAREKLHNFPIDKDHLLELQWAKQPPSSIWRFDGPPARGPPPERARSRSPPRRRDDRGPPPRSDRGYNGGPPRGGYEDRRGPVDPRGSYDDRSRRGYDDRRPPSRSYESRGGHDDRNSRSGYPPAESRSAGYPPTEPRSAGGYSDRAPPAGGYGGDYDSSYSDSRRRG